MKKWMAPLALLVALGACRNDQKDSRFDTKSYEQAKESLGEKEKKSPAKFLLVSSHDRKNLIGQTVVKGSITNRATLCWFKDVELHLSFFSKTGVKLDESLETVYENIGPGKTVKFKTRTFAPKGTDSVSVIVNKATGDISNTK